MIKHYKVKTWSDDPGQYFTDLDVLKEYVYDADRYASECYESLIDSFDEVYDGWSYGGCSWSPHEVLNALDEDSLNSWVNSEAEYRVENDLPEQYDDEIEELEVGQSLKIYETDCTIECVEIEPENDEEAAELGLNLAAMQSEAASLI